MPCPTNHLCKFLEGRLECHSNLATYHNNCVHLAYTALGLNISIVILLADIDLFKSRSGLQRRATIEPSSDVDTPSPAIPMAVNSISFGYSHGT